ncbi:glycosyltransferase family 2 protein [bacterium]|nr:glycosyltransferase family 2 protein [bacterium]
MTEADAMAREDAPFLSVVIPAYNEKDNIAPLAAAIGEVLPRDMTRELIFVNDGSSDGSLETLRALAAADPSVRYLSFSRNFGHQAALRAGIEAARGECTVMMDGDFQHPPALIPELIAAYRRGFDIVQTRRLDEGAPAGDQKAAGGRPARPGKRASLGKRLSSRLFYSLVNALSDTRIEPGTADFRLLSRRAREAVLALREHNLFLRGALPWIGFPTAIIDYVPAERRSGVSKYSLSKMFSLALDGITSFSTRPLRLTSFAGLLISGAGFAYALYALIVRLFTNKAVEGWTSLLISVLIIGGIQLLSLGILGEYLGKLFLEAKGRPHYIVAEASPVPPPSGTRAPSAAQDSAEKGARP